MRRRRFLALAGGSLIVQQLGLPSRRGHAQQLPARLGILVGGIPNPGPFLKNFREGLQALGYDEGRNIRLEIRSAEGRGERLPALAAELVRLNVDIIVTYQTPTAQAAKDATSEIPIVMASAGDPVGTGLVASLARPGGNITGMATATAEAGGKCVQLLRELSPAARRVAALCNELDPFSAPFLEQVQQAATLSGIAAVPVFSRGPADLERAFAAIAGHAADLAVMQPSLGTTRVAELAVAQRLPAASPTRAFALAGGLISYSGNQAQIFRDSATYVDRILKGARAADLPVQLPTTFDLVVNLRTAKALGVEVPSTLLWTADEVIE